MNTATRATSLATVLLASLQAHASYLPITTTPGIPIPTGALPASLSSCSTCLFDTNSYQLNSNISYLRYIDTDQNPQPRVLIRYELAAGSALNTHYYDEDSQSYNDNTSPLSGSLWLDMAETYDLNGTGPASPAHRVGLYFEQLNRAPFNSHSGSDYVELNLSNSDLLTGRIELGISGDPDYLSYGSSTFAPGDEPFVCVECSYHLELDLAGFSYREHAGSAHLYGQLFESHPAALLTFSEGDPTNGDSSTYRALISEVPLPAGGWLFVSALASLALQIRRG